jgi:cytochrome P450
MTEVPVQADDLRALAGMFDPAIVADPYPRYAQWRAERPLARPRERMYVLSRFADCEAVLADPAFGRLDEDDKLLTQEQAQAVGWRADRVNARSLLRLNPPDHTRLRRLVSRAFTPARVRELAPRVEALTAGLLAGALDGPDGRFDLISGLALPLPVAVISELLGIPEADRSRLVAWSDALARALDPGFLISEEDRARQREARLEFAAYLRGLLPARRRSPGDDLISALIGAGDADGALTEEELLGLCMLLLIAGHETTRSLIGSAVLALLRNPAELAALAADDSLVEQAVEEVLRYDPPVQLLGRFALRPTAVAGQPVGAGSFVLMFLGAANRDPELCPDPDRFSVGRGIRRHLAFGHGIHFCLGAPLARLEAAIALRQLLPLLPRLEIAEEPEWKPNTVLRGLEHLWLAPASRPASR